MPYRLSPVTPSRRARRVPYRPTPGTALGMNDRRVRYRLSPDRVRYDPSPDHVPAPFDNPGVPAVPTVGRAKRPSFAISRPNSAWSRRRHRRFTNMYSFTCLWRSIKSPSAARLRRTVGPLASRHAVAGQSQQRDIIGHIRAYPGIVRTSSEHRPGISGHFRAYSDTRGRRMPYCPSPDRVP